MVTIRALAAREWETFRDLRLRALFDAPDAFGPTYDDAAARDDAYWQDAARRFAESDAADLFVAWRGRRPVGLVSAVGGGGVGGVGAMWVEPSARGAGLARRLLVHACDVLATRGCTRVTLSVTETNARAIALYESLGFERTGDVHPLREGSPLAEIEMARER